MKRSSGWGVEPTICTPKDSILFDQIRQGLPLPLIQPADRRGKQQPQRKNVDHGGRVYLADRDSAS
jgi:hypothetical protein